MGCCCSGKNARVSEDDSPVDHTRLVEEESSESDEDGSERGWECPICLSSKKANTIATPCAHVYHRHCLKSWLVKYDKCPVCNTKIILT